jgi:catechol 2,3-dioxygenase-like lactoylglutathione lyase family enzyme
MNLNQVTLPASDVAESVAFYRSLGFTQIVAHLPSYARFECPDGGSTFSIHHVENTPNDSGVIVYFECDDVDTTVAALKAKGIPFESEPVNQRWLWREAYLRDPAGNRICLYHAGTNRRHPPWRLGSEKA